MSVVAEASDQLTDDERAISPVVGIALMVVILVVLVALVASMLTGFGDQLVQPAPYSSFETDYHPAGEGNGGVAYVNFRHEAGAVSDGEKLFVVDSDGNEVAWADVWTGDETVQTPGFVHIDGKGSDCALNAIRKGEVYRLVRKDPDGSTQLLSEYEVELAPANPGTFTC